MNYRVLSHLEDINAKLDPLRGGRMPNDMHDLQNPGQPVDYNPETVYHHMSVPLPQIQQTQEAEYITHTQQPGPPPEQVAVQEQRVFEPKYDSGFNEFFINQAMMEQFPSFDPTIQQRAMETMGDMDLEVMVDMEP